MKYIIKTHNKEQASYLNDEVAQRLIRITEIGGETMFKEFKDEDAFIEEAFDVGNWDSTISVFKDGKEVIKSFEDFPLRSLAIRYIKFQG
mgnify:FL=1|tara:strand:- start:955 stop:1224 length:270 start_codon:yes stop_codon:yes gene_type:complete